MPDTPETPEDWTDLEQIMARGNGALQDKMGIRVTEVSSQRVVGTMPVEGNTQPFGLLHGGASVVLAEGLGSLLANLLAGPGRMAVGTEINASHHRPGLRGWVTGVATPVAVGRTTACIEIVITDEDGKRVCTSRLTVAMRELPQDS